MFNERDVKSILSQEHLRNTAHALGKDVTDVTPDDLVEHWKRYNFLHPTEFIVEPNLSDGDGLFT